MDKVELKNIKGTFDYLPNEQILKNKIINKLSKVFESYGYLPLETTTLCYYDLLASKYAGGAEILKEVYKLEDQGKRNLGLRYDLTVPFAKVISMNKGLSLPFKRYEIGKVYRDGPVKLGRNREFYQCDVDVCGIQGRFIEAELLSMAVNGYKSLGIDIYIEWNNRKLLSGLISECDIDEEYISKVILSVDKLAKIGEDGVREELKEYNIDNIKLDKLFSFFKLNMNELKERFICTNNNTLKEGLEEVLELSNYIEKLGLTECVFTPYLARGLEIYTGVVFEVFDKKKRITSSIGAGGRYDKIITNFIDDGNEYPALGMTFGLAPIYEILNMENKDKEELYDLLIIPMGCEIESLNLANKLRNSNVKVVIEMKKKLNKSLDWANRNNIPYVIIIGENEVNSNKIKIKDMNDSTEYEVELDNIDKILDIIRK